MPTPGAMPHERQPRRRTRPRPSSSPLLSTLARVAAAGAALLGLLAPAPADAYSLIISQAVDAAEAGSPWGQQPAVTVLDDNGDVASSFSGFAYASMQASPTGYETLLYNGTMTPTLNKVPFVSGIAQLKDLYINEMGSGYVVRLIGADAAMTAFAYVDTDSFSVTVGAIHKIALAMYPGTATGGLPFSPQPMVAVQDIGGNTVASHQGGTVTVYLHSSAVAGATLLGTTTAEVINGLASFNGLSIAQAGSPYTLGFTTDIALDGARMAYSNPFAVGVGPAASLRFVEEISDGATVGGQAFQVQPRLEILDAGGNLRAADSTSGVQADFLSNPTGGTLTPSEYAFETVTKGSVSFALLSIDRTGDSFVLRFTLYEYDAPSSSFTATSVAADSQPFNVVLGDPQRISVTRDVSNAWAGGQAFMTQPLLNLYDAGGNRVLTDSETVIQANMVTSLSVKATVVVDTSTGRVPRVKTVKASADGTYTIGDTVTVDVTWDAFVIAAPGAGLVPELVLALHNATGPGQPRLWQRARCMTLNTRAQTLRFQYIVDGNVSTGDLHTHPDALKLRGATITDNFKRAVNLTLPDVPGRINSLSGSSAVVVDTAAPSVAAASILNADGEYGVGATLQLQLDFTHAVAVVGAPRVPLNLLGVNGTERWATYVSGTGTTALVFGYTVVDDDTVADLDTHATKANLTYPIGAAIYRQAAVPSLKVSTALPAVGTLGAAHAVSVDTARPVVDAAAGLSVWVWQAGADVAAHTGLLAAPVHTYTVGDLLYIRVPFDKAVVASQGAMFKLHTGTYAPGYAFYDGGTGTAVLWFRYAVALGDDCSVLNMYSAYPLVATGNEYLKRDSDVPTTDVIWSFQSVIDAGTNIADGNALTLDGTAPTVASVSLSEMTLGLLDAWAGTGTDHSKTFGLDETVYIDVNMTHPVVVLKNSPVLMIAAGSKSRAAVLDSRNGTTLRFAYTVMMGDRRSAAQTLSYTYSASGTLCAEKTCDGVTGLLARACDYCENGPSLAANLEVPLTGGTSNLGVPISGPPSHANMDHLVMVETDGSRLTTVAAVSTTHASGTVGVGENFYIQVKFTDEVVSTGMMPSLFLNTNYYASYVGGDGTDTWEFFYRSQPSHNVVGLNWASMGNPATLNGIQQETAIFCNSSALCGMNNRDGIGVSVDFSGGAVAALTPTDITIDNAVPQVVRVYTDKADSPYPGKTYTVGESVNVYVEYDLEVAVSGVPLLYLETGDVDQVVEYAADLAVPSDKFLGFVYVVQEGDATTNLTYASRFALTNNFEQARIARKSTSSTTIANYTLPPVGPLALGAPGGTGLSIDTTKVPEVVEVTSPEAAGTYSPGDVLRVDVVFNEVVVVTGTPFLTLELGQTDGRAMYVSGTGTTTLRLEYTVRAGDITYDLDYVDSHALELGPGGSILMASTTPTTPAKMSLAYVGQPGSLGANAAIAVDGATPYITDMGWVTPTPTAGLGDTVQIYVDFTTAVNVTGLPRLLLETGDYDSHAVFSGGSGTTRLTFDYTVKLGDMASKLDYVCVEEQLRSAVDSFDLNGGSIRRQSTAPLLAADVHLNPPGGFLSGMTDATISVGIAAFGDLEIVQRGPDYKLRYSATPSYTGKILRTSSDVFVAFSSEFEVRASDAEKNDRLGWAVDMSGDRLLVGAPNKHKTVDEVQFVRSSGNGLAAPGKQMQLVVSEVAWVPEVQQFITSADPLATVGGTFTIGYGVYGPTRPIDAGALPEQVQTYLKLDLSSQIGPVTVSREPYEWCACEDGYIWRVTFLNKRGGVDELTVDGAGLTGPGAAVLPLTTEVDSPVANGTFRLTHNGLRTSEIDVRAHAADVGAAIEADLKLPVHTIYTADVTEDGGRKWAIEFADVEDAAYNKTNNDVPVLGSEQTHLGTGTTIWHKTAREGTHPLYGHFKLQFRTGGYTAPIAYDATGADVEAALEALPTVDDVTVTRGAAEDDSGYTWTVTFHAVREETVYGFVATDMSNLPGMVAEYDGILQGTDAKVTVGYTFGTDVDYARWHPKRMGAYGDEAGAAYVFTRSGVSGDQWLQTAKIVPGKGSAYDHFGTSVSIDGGIAAVGAPSATDHGDNEAQTLTCDAYAVSGGSFTVSFRGFTTAPIAHDVSAAGLQAALTGDALDVSDPLHPLPKVTVTFAYSGHDSGAAGNSGALCHNNTATIVFDTPGDGPNGADIEDLVVDASGLTLRTTPYAVGVDSAGTALTVAESVKGTALKHGTGASVRGAQKGAAFVFKRGAGQSLDWTEKQRLSLPAGVSGDRFGESIAVNGDVLVVGAPGKDSNAGAAYVYEYDRASALWVLEQTLTSEVWSVTAGDLFGASVALSGDAFVVGAPGYTNGTSAGGRTGAAFTFKRGTMSYFQADQRLMLEDGADKDELGCSTAIHADTLIVGACRRAAKTIHLGTLPPGQARASSGAVFSFLRNSPNYPFKLSQELTPSNVRAFDRFGLSVSVSNNTCAVTSLEEFKGDLVPRKSVQVVTTSASRGAAQENVGDKFTLSWRDATAADGTVTKRTSRGIESDVSTSTLAEIIVTDLETGYVTVSRTAVDALDGGYSWHVTFHDQNGGVPLMEADGAFLTGDMAAVTVEHVNRVPEKVRGVAHLFDRASSTDQWVEQAYLYPKLKQRQDNFARAVVVDGDYAAVGAPNRDSFVSGVNSGAAVAFNINFLKFKFSQAAYGVAEGQTLDVTLNRDRDTHQILALNLVSYDRNWKGEYQSYVADLYDLPDAPPYGTTHADLAGQTTAHARAQYYGSAENRSIWVDAMYDYRGVSDYLPIDEPVVAYGGSTSVTVQFKSTADAVVESPNENASVMLWMPGMWPSPIGDLHSVVEIQDDGDGVGAAGVMTAFAKLYAGGGEVADHFGTAVAVDDANAVAVFGAAGAGSGAGAAYAFARTAGAWAQTQELVPTLDGTPLASGARFGESVAVGVAYGRTASEAGGTTILVGAPGVARVFVFGYDGAAFVQLATFSAPEAVRASHMFGGRGTVALSEDVAVVGAPGLDKAYVFERQYQSGSQTWAWQAAVEIVSNDYDYDLVLGAKKVHEQGFGAAVAISGRTVVVGAPHADYGNRGSAYVEMYDTDGVDNKGLGKGKAFVFYSAPSVAQVTLRADASLRGGTWRLALTHRNLTAANTTKLSFDASASDVKAAVEGLAAVNEVEVTRLEDGFGYAWDVTFATETVTPPLFAVLWDGYGCVGCEAFSAPWAQDASEQMRVERTSTVGAWAQHAELQAADKNSADLFGFSVALDADQLVVGAPHSSALATTTWDFETGDLNGWSATGTAFASQPTYGDNSYKRSVYGGIGDRRSHGKGQRALPRGRYYIGTYEARPGAGAADYTRPLASAAAGTAQGDAPQGTLTSEPFVILGKDARISLLVGGGCDHLKVYAELLVDGSSVARATGKCNEAMRNVTWDVSAHRLRSAQLRVVDASSANWGHINVDHVVFSWAHRGGRLHGTDEAGKKALYAQKESTPWAGAAYTFRRKAAGTSAESCAGDKRQCAWAQQAKLVATNTRRGSMFGYSVAVDDATGTAAVGAHRAPGVGFYGEVPTLHPHRPATTAVTFPMASKSAPQQQRAQNTLAPQRSGANAVRAAENRAAAAGQALHAQDAAAFAECGSVYLFTREPELLTSQGELVSEPLWSPSETLALQAPGQSAGDHFGAAVALSGTNLLVGAADDDGAGRDGGAAYSAVTDIQHVAFEHAEYVALEGTDGYITVGLVRSVENAANALTVAYATSDLTAHGIDAGRYAECAALPQAQREGCGDYLQAAGEATFAAGATTALFNVYIMNDNCLEHYAEYVQLTLGVPGAGPALGEGYAAKLRIDDDDFTADECSWGLR